MNILICSVGRRVKLIEYFKRELNKYNGKVIAIDCDLSAAALYHADQFEVVPRITDPEYIDHLKHLCAKYSIDAVLSLIDPELTLLASVKEEFYRNGIQIIVSDQEVVDICSDKFLTYQFLHENQLPGVPTYMDINAVIHELSIGNISFPLIVKPKNGSASIGIYKVSSFKELNVFLDKTHDYIIQPFIAGDELGIDCYIDFITNKTTNIFMKRKITMRAGETDKSISIKDPELKQLIENLIDKLKPKGPIDIDCFKTENGYLISEINPRFGGGYLHAHELGEDFVRNIINNLKGEPNLESKSDYKEGTIMIKYDQCLII